jgi:hypothetical protein
MYTSICNSTLPPSFPLPPPIPIPLSPPNQPPCPAIQDWLWPAIWLLPEKNAYGQWPASGEIDLMESRGNKPGYIKGACVYVCMCMYVYIYICMCADMYTDVCGMWGVCVSYVYLAAYTHTRPHRRGGTHTHTHTHTHNSTTQPTPPPPTNNKTQPPPPPPTNNNPGGYDSFGSCMHWGPYFALDYFEMTCQSYTLPDGTFNDEFHTFGLYWDEVRWGGCVLRFIIL